MGGVRFEAIPFAGIEPEPHEVAEARELHRLVLNAVNSLSPRNRAATLLFYYDQLSVREVASARDFRSRTRGSESVPRRFKERVFEGQ